MAGRQGRPRKFPGQPATTPPDHPVSQLFSPDHSRVVCALCERKVPEIEGHLLEDHPAVSLAEYVLRYPSHPMKGAAEPKKPKLPAVSVREAAEHPAGRDGAIIEKMLPVSERTAYREDIQGLLAAGYMETYLIAGIAYKKVLARRYLLEIETIRDESKGQVWGTEKLDTYTELSEAVAAGLKDLESKKRAREDEERKRRQVEDPLAVHERELVQAEQWVKANIGEHESRCPNPTCGQMLLLPDLPHWAYEPLVTDRGVQWPVWSRELWALVRTGELALWQMAYALRTSPEGLKYTAAKRGEDWPASIDLAAEEAELRKRLDVQDFAALMEP